MASDFRKAIRRESLFKALGVKKGKLTEAGFRQLNVKCLNSRGELVAVMDVKVYALGESPGFHRVYVKCPDCQKYLPFGRYHTHVGTATCKRNQSL